MGLVKSVGLWHGVLAFGFGLVLGQCFDGVPAVEEAPVYEGAAYDGAEPVPARRPADEPVTAQRRWTGARARGPATAPSQEAPPTEAPTRTERRMPTR
jgi:hypothetical protein